MKRALCTFLGVVSLLGPLAPAEAAAFVRQFPVQKTTQLMPGRYSLTFNLYDAPAGGVRVFTEKKTITLTSSVLKHALGSANKAGMSRVDFSQQLYLEIKRGTAVVVKREIFPVARVERDAKDLAERCFVVLGWKPVCPCDGVYDAHPVTREPSCSVHGSDTSPLAGAPVARPLIRDLRREGATVRCRVPVDWR